MSKDIKTEVIVYWGKTNSHTAALTARGDLILYWGKKNAPAFTLRGAEVCVETETHITVQPESPVGFIELEGVGTYSWRKESEGYRSFIDTRGRTIRVSPNGDVEEETFTPIEAQKVNQEVSKSKAKNRGERSSKTFQSLIGVASLLYLLKVLFQ
jgi:hypothetical protein